MMVIWFVLLYFHRLLLITKIIQGFKVIFYRFIVFEFNAIGIITIIIDRIAVVSSVIFIHITF